jgi:hypothetical protein
MEDEMDGACSTHRRQLKYSYTSFCSENLKVRDHFYDLGVDRRIILNCVLKEYTGSKWPREPVNAVMNLQFP